LRLNAQALVGVVGLAAEVEARDEHGRDRSLFFSILQAEVVVEILDAPRERGVGVAGEPVAPADGLRHHLAAVLARELEQPGAVELVGVGALDRLPVALLPVPDEVGVQHARPAGAALEEREVQLGEASGDAAQEHGLGHGVAGRGEVADVGCSRDATGRRSRAPTPTSSTDSRLLEFARKYGSEVVAEAVGRGDGLAGDSNSTLTGGVEDLDDYFRCKIEKKRRPARTLFVRASTSAARADDPTNAWAFKPQGQSDGRAAQRAVRSDIGHFDVPDMAEVVPEAYELVEARPHRRPDFRDFMFTNAVRFWGEVNPDFFKGTVVEKAAAEVLAQGVRVA